MFRASPIGYIGLGMIVDMTQKGTRGKGIDRRISEKQDDIDTDSARVTLRDLSRNRGARRNVAEDREMLGRDGASPFAF